MVNIEAVKNKKKNEAHICTTYSIIIIIIIIIIVY